LRRLAGVATLLVVGALVAGCGDSNDDALSKSEFVAKANAVCTTNNKKIEDAANDTFSKGRPSAADLEKFTTQTVVPVSQDTIDKIKDLSPPKDDEDQVNAILASAQTTTDKLKADPSSNSESNDPYAETNKLAKAYGLDACAG
jgi:hypothetical protein